MSGWPVTRLLGLMTGVASDANVPFGDYIVYVDESGDHTVSIVNNPLPDAPVMTARGRDPTFYSCPRPLISR